MLNNQPRILTPEESAFAAKNFTHVYFFLSENNLSEDDYYDPAINGFLKAVQEYQRSGDSADFKQFADAMMGAECTDYDEALHKIPTILSLSECYRSAYELEETIADVKNTIDEAIAAISLDETMKSFDDTQRRIVRLLLEGYSKMDIATMLQMNINTLFEQICSIQNKTMANPLMMAA